MQHRSSRTPRTAGPRPLRALLLALACALCLAFAGALPARALEAPAVNATAALLVDPDTGTVLYESNADDTRYPASTTKIMTALLTLEHADLDAAVTVEASDLTEVTPESTIAGLLVGEQYTVRDLLYGMLLPSGNDAAYVLARYVGGSVEQFVQMMNDRAAELGCTNTHFANPCGLHDDNHWSCARDLYRMAYAAMQNPVFAQIVATPTYTMPATDKQPAHDLENTNLLLQPEASCYYAPCFGIKTGYTEDAGRCLVAAAEQNGVTLYCVVLGCPNPQAAGEVSGGFTAALTLFNWAYGNWSERTVADAGYEVQSAPVAGAVDDEQLSIVLDGPVRGLVPNDLTLEGLQAEVSLPESFTAPVEEGASLGTVTYRYNGAELGTVGLVAGNEVEISIPALLGYMAACVAVFARGLAAQVLASRELTIAVACGIVAVAAVAVAALIVHRKRRRARIAAEQERMRAGNAAVPNMFAESDPTWAGQQRMPAPSTAVSPASDPARTATFQAPKGDTAAAPRKGRIADRVPHIGVGDEKRP